MNSREILVKMLDRVIERYWDILPVDILASRANAKSADYFAHVMLTMVSSFYRGYMDLLEFVFVFGDLISGQMRRAWYEGMEENQLTPMDMTDEWEAILQEIIDGEKSYIVDFADAIEAARLAGNPIEPLMARTELWLNRYLDVVNQAKLETAEPKDKLVWRLGATEQHCSTCVALNGIVASASEWEEVGFHPQGPENGMLECRGWRCDCSLDPTDERRTYDRMNRLYAIATGG